MRHFILPTTLLLTMGGCSDVDSHDHDHHHHDHNHGIPTTLDLIARPMMPLIRLHPLDRSENDGDPIIDPIVLTDGSDTNHAPRHTLSASASTQTSRKKQKTSRQESMRLRFRKCCLWAMRSQDPRLATMQTHLYPRI